MYIAALYAMLGWSPTVPRRWTFSTSPALIRVFHISLLFQETLICQTCSLPIWLLNMLLAQRLPVSSVSANQLNEYVYFATLSGDLSCCVIHCMYLFLP